MGEEMEGSKLPHIQMCCNYVLLTQVLGNMDVLTPALWLLISAGGYEEQFKNLTNGWSHKEK